MKNDFIWIFIIVINIAGFFIQIERPIWVYYVQKWTTLNIEIRSRLEISANVTNLLIFVIFYVLFAIKNQSINYFFAVLLLFYTSLSLIKLINAIPTNSKPKRLIFKVVDSFSFRNVGKGHSQKFIVVKAENSEIGVHILPAFPYNFDSKPSPNSNMSILYRKGLLGIIYRFSFDYV